MSMPETARRSCPSQTLGKVIACNNFQDARRFLGGEHDRPRSGSRPSASAVVSGPSFAKASMRSTSALFMVICEDMVYRLEAGGSKELKALVNWQNELSEVDGFSPVIIGGPIESPDPLNPGRTTHG